MDGNIVPDGEYTVLVEFTEKHAQGPLFEINFTKGPDAQNITPPDESYFKDLSLTFTPLVADFSVNTNVVCEEETVAFIDQSVNATSWLWNFGEGAEPATANTIGPHMVYYITSGSKTVELTINGSLTETKENYITVSISPAADFTFSGEEYTVDFTNTSVNANSYLWDFGDGSTSIENNPVHTYPAAGTYVVALTATYLNCDNSISYDVSVPLTRIESSLLNEIVNIYPNPNNGTFALELPKGFACQEITITDQSGRTIKEYEYLSPQSSDIIQIDLGDVEKGLYFVEVNGNQSKLTRKFIVR
ncbi:MAG: PKD domain-containing protein [Bacteroidales bacterium]